MQLHWRPLWYRDPILERLPRGGIGVEVGVWAGEFSERILRIVQPRFLHLVDQWKQVPGHPSRRWGGNGNTSQAKIEQAYKSATVRLHAETRAGRVVIHRNPSVDAAKEFPDGSVDFVYLDADHRYHAVLADLSAWWPKVKAGGALAGDDYDLPQSDWDDGVTRAVDNFSAVHCTRLTYLGRHQFLISRE